MAGPVRRVGAALAGLAVLVGAHAGCGEPERPAGPLTVAAGSTGGIYYAYAHALADVARDRLPGLRPDVLVTSASVENVRLVADGRAQVGFTLADSAAAAVAGDPPFARRQPVRALARLYDNHVHLVARADGPVDELADLRGRDVSLGAVGSGTELTATRLVEVAGLAGALRPVRLGLLASAAALRDGDVDAFFWSGGLPTPVVSQLARAPGVRLVPLAGTAQRMRDRYGDFYAEATVPASTYRTGRAVPTLAVPNYLLVRRSMSAALAYDLTRTLFEERPALARAHAAGRQLNLRAAIATYPVPLHPGARRYYREAAG